MKIAPARALDVGVGFGRWGMILREFCDVWYSRIFADQWAVHIEGIEAFPRSITDYHHQFYNRIHLGDASELLPALPGPWDVVIFGDVLEHFTKEKGRELLTLALSRSAYVLVNIPIGEDHPQGDMYGNVYERHLSSWDPADFAEFHLVRHVLLRDYIGRPYASFILSKDDPKNLRAGLFAPVSVYNDDPALAATKDDLDRLLDRAADQAFELAFIKRSRLYRLAKRWRRTALGRVLARSRDGVVVRALGEKAPASAGLEAWLLHASGLPGGASVPWDFVLSDGGWSRRHEPQRAHGQCMSSSGGGVVVVRLGPDPELRFLRHPWSGKVEVSYRGRQEVIDLYAAESEVVRVFPARSPMLAGKRAAPQHGHAAQIVMPVVESRAPAAPAAPRATPTTRTFSASEAGFIEAVRSSKPRAVAVTFPRYLGVTSSTVNLFEHCYRMPADPTTATPDLSDDDIAHHARVLLETGVGRIVLSGGDESQHRLMRTIKARSPCTRCDLFFHGSYPQFSEDDVWQVFKKWVDSARSGDVHTIASDKFGYDRFIRSLGLRGAVLLNRVPGPLLDWPDLPDEPRRVGIWLSGETYRKIPHAMLAAVRMMEATLLHGSGLRGRAREVVEYLDIPRGEIAESQLPHDELFAAMRRTHLTLYVTFIECCPMLPLESLHQGVPALLGPNSHLFEDCPFLFERLVVPFPERAEVIADYAARAIRERREIIAAYKAYYPAYDARARASVAEFLAS